MIPLNEAVGGQIFFDSLGALFLLASSILPGNRDSAEEILLKAYGRWQKRPEKEQTLQNAQRDVAVEALELAAARPQELILSPKALPQLPAETEPVLALPLRERIVFLMGSICHFGIEEISKLLRLPIADIRSARINAFRMLPKMHSMRQARSA